MIHLPRVRRSALLFALPVLAACRDAGGKTARPDPNEPAERPEFNADRAYTYLRDQVGFGPRYAGTPGHQRQLAWMTDFLRTAGADSVWTQPFTHVAQDGKTLQLTNVLARFGAKNPDRILLVAHWDTRPHADQAADPEDRRYPVPGANDGASGVAVILEIAQALRENPLPVGLDVLLTDGEDYGPSEDDMYLGAKWYASHLPDGPRPRFAVVLDMVGDKDPAFKAEERSRRAAPQVVARIWSLAKEMGYGDVFVDGSAGEIDDDHVPLIQAGIKAVDVIDMDYGPDNVFWHTPQDLPPNTSPETLRAVGNVVAELLYRGG